MGVILLPMSFSIPDWVFALLITANAGTTLLFVWDMGMYFSIAESADKLRDSAAKHQGEVSRLAYTP